MENKLKNKLPLIKNSNNNNNNNKLKIKKTIVKLKSTKFQSKSTNNIIDNNNDDNNSISSITINKTVNIKKNVEEIFNNLTLVHDNCTTNVIDGRLKRDSKESRYGNRKHLKTAIKSFGSDDDISSLGDWSSVDGNSLFDEHSMVHPNETTNIDDNHNNNNNNNNIRKGTNVNTANSFKDYNNNKNTLTHGSSSASLMTGRCSSRGNYTARSTALTLFDESFLPPGGRPNTVTMKELIIDIKHKIIENNDPPDYMLSIDELPKEKITWNGRARIIPIIEPILKPFDLSETITHQNIQKLKSLTINTNLDNNNNNNNNSFSPLLSSSSISTVISSPISSNNNNNNKNKNKIIMQPIVDIIGCNQSVELLLAKADLKLRKQYEAKLIVEQKQIEEKNDLLSSIEYRNRRIERVNEMLENKELQSLWLKNIIAIKYIELLIKRKEKNIKSTQNVMTEINARHFVQDRLTYLLRRIRKRIVVRFLRALGKSAWTFRLHVRVRARRAAAKKIKLFLTIWKEQRLVSFMVRQYFAKVHRCQKIARDMISCTRGRLIVLEKFWLVIEKKYLKFMIHKQTHNDLMKKQSREKLKSLKKNESGEAAFDKSKSTMNHIINKNYIDIPTVLKGLAKQGDMWEKIDGQIEDTLAQLRITGSSAKRKTMDEMVEELLIHGHEKHVILRDLLSRKRKEYLLIRSNVDVSKAKYGSVGHYSNNDALTLLKGTKKAINQLILRELHAEFDASITPPFYMFQYISKSLMLELIHLEHERLKTFIVHIDFEIIKKNVL